jgi:hypothetical protein
MKKIIMFVALISMVFASVSFCAWKSWEDFNSYKDARKAATEAEASGDTSAAVANYKKAADLAGKSATKDIQAWQTNNAAFVLIKQFKTLVAYDDKLAKLADMKPSKDKLAFQKEMATMFSMKMDVLNEAKALLEGGKALDGGEAPTAKIQSNIDYIDWVNKFVADNTGDAKQVDAVVPAAAKGETVKTNADADPKADPKPEAKTVSKEATKEEPKK